MVTRRTGYASRTTNYLLYKTRNPTPAAAPKGFGAMVGAEAAWCRGTPVTLGTPIQGHPSGKASLPITANLCSPRTGPHIPQAILTVEQAPGQPCPGAQHPVAEKWLLFSAAK